MGRTTPPMVPESRLVADRFVEVLPQLLLALQKAWNSQPIPTQLTLRQVQALLTLSSSDNLSVNRLCEELGIAQSTGSELLERMSRLGMVTRRTCLTDKRSATLSITRSGADLLREWRVGMVRSCTKQFGRLGPTERAVFLEALNGSSPIVDTVEEIFHEK